MPRFITTLESANEDLNKELISNLVHSIQTRYYEEGIVNNLKMFEDKRLVHLVFDFDTHYAPLVLPIPHIRSLKSTKKKNGYDYIARTDCIFEKDVELIYRNIEKQMEILPDLDTILEGNVGRNRNSVTIHIPARKGYIADLALIPINDRTHFISFSDEESERKLSALKDSMDKWSR